MSELMCCVRPTSVGEKEPPDCSVITDYLSLSACFGLTGSYVKSLGVTAVVNCINGVKKKYAADIEYLHVPLEDTETENMLQYVPTVTDLIERHRASGGRTLVFCGLGISRSSSFVIAYFMRFHCMTLREAYQFVQARRQEVCPNTGFFQQLISYEHELTGIAEPSVKIIKPMGNLSCADVVWEEVSKEVNAELQRTFGVQQRLVAAARH